MKKLMTLAIAAMMVFGFVAMASAETLVPGTTCEDDPGYINRGCTTSQYGCIPFDYEDTSDCSSYCGQKGTVHRLYINLCICEENGAFVRNLLEGDTVDVSMTILVDKLDGKGPVTGDHGVYWGQDVNRQNVYGINMQPVVHDSLDCSSDFCYCSRFDGPFIYLLANGTEGSVRYSRHETACDFDASERVVKIIPDTTSESHGYVISSQDTDPVNWRCNFAIDVPRMVVDPNVAERNDEVYVRVCLTAISGDPEENKRPLCPGGGCCYDLYVGKMCCPQDSELVFPYVTDMGNELWWFGLVLTSGSDVTGNVNIYYFEKDGDKASMTTTIPARKLLILTPSDLLAALVLSSKSTGSKVLGDTQGYFVVDADILMSGFCMMGEPDTGQSMGYLPQGGALGGCVSEDFHGGQY